MSDKQHKTFKLIQLLHTIFPKVQKTIQKIWN